VLVKVFELLLGLRVAHASAVLGGYYPVLERLVAAEPVRKGALLELGALGVRLAVLRVDVNQIHGVDRLVEGQQLQLEQQQN